MITTTYIHAGLKNFKKIIFERLIWMNLSKFCDENEIFLAKLFFARRYLCGVFASKFNVLSVNYLEENTCYLSTTDTYFYIWKKNNAEQMYASNI